MSSVLNSFPCVLIGQNRESPKEDPRVFPECSNLAPFSKLSWSLDIASVSAIHSNPHENLQDWSSYLKLGISLEHVPELMRMVSDEELYQADAEGVEWGAPIHAWRILG